jgi:hypothetical protein
VRLNRVLQFALLAMAAGELSAAAAQALILRSLGPSAGRYPPGTRTPPGASFVLRPGDSVSILANGTTRTFRGPGTFSANGAAAASGIASANVRRNTGAVRTGDNSEPVRVRSDIWQYDVTSSGRACILAGHPLTLWRPTSARTVQLSIMPQTGPVRTLGWSAGQSILAWPSDLPLADGASYQLSWSGDAAPTRVTTRMLGRVDANDLDAVAAALIANHCDGQVGVLIALRDAAAAETRR